MANKLDPKIPPQNIDAEMSLIGAVLIDTDAIVRVADSIDVTDFYDERHQRIFEAVKKLYERHRPIDILTLSNQLRDDGFLEVVGGASYLTELTNYVPTAAHAEHYAEIVADKALRRRLIKASQDIVGIGYDEARPVKEIIEEAEVELFQVSQRHVKQDIESIESILATSFERLDELHKGGGGVRGVPTGFKDLDNIIAGWQKSDLVVLAA